MEQNEKRMSLLSQIVELNKKLTGLNDGYNTILRKQICVERCITEYDLALAEAVAMPQVLEEKRAELESSQKKLAELERCIKDLDSQISKQTARIKTEKEESVKRVKIAKDKVKDWWSEYVASFTFDIDGKSLQLSVKLFREIAAKVIQSREATSEIDANSNYGRANYVMGTWMQSGILSRLFNPLLESILFGFYKCMIVTPGTDSIKKEFCENYEKYSKKPNQRELKETIDSALSCLFGVPINDTLVKFEWNDKITELLPQLVDLYCPVYHELKQIFFTDTSEFDGIESSKSDKNDSDAFKNLLVELGLWLELIKKELGSVYKLTAAEFGFEPAVKELARECGYQTVSAAYGDRILWPVFNGKADTDYPSVSTGLAAGEEPVIHLKMIDFFTSDTSSLNHFLSVQYVKAGNKQEVAATVMQSILASIMAWMGPKKFTLDVVDFEYSGIGAYPAQFLPKDSVKILSSLTDWDDELNSIENLIAKRSQKMQSIFQYNRSNPDNIELFKIVVIQDYEGILVKLEDNKYETRESERQKANVRRFLRFLELGYKYGIIFLVGSQEGVYNSSVKSIAIGNLSYFSNPYKILKVEGIDGSVPDSFMKWLADGEDPATGKNKVKAGEQHDGVDGILTTEIAEDGADVEFRMDTVSHTHAFVIGKTGSGKSVLLHNIITGLVNSYSPDDLELYLLDLKMGGVEFNRYRRLPHLRSLLVDNSDIQIVLEIMRDIELMMRERGKAFRNSEVSNIKEYNRANPEKKMPQVIVVIDECHAIFSMDGRGGAAKEQREITERLVKIAKEGRSQGIHLIFATQTLSGSEIPPEIRKNITDFYLLKCDQSDSESLVRGSSSETEALPVGKVYYYHADRQALFQGANIDKKACEELIAEALQRHQGRASHGQFYFNGAQTFELSREIANTLNTNNGHAVAGSPGRMINLQQTPIAINLKKDYSENVLLTGINNDEQLSRTTLALMGSHILAAKAVGIRLKVNVINCLDPDAEASALLREMADNGVISLYRPADSDSLLKRLCGGISQKTLSEDTMLYIIGQERFGELKRDQKFAKESGSVDMVMDIFQGMSFSESSSAPKAQDSYKKAIEYLLENGPSAGLHTVIQVDKPDKLLFDEYLSAKTVSARFKHIVILRSDARSGMSLGLSDDINVESLSADPERLRAYYYNDDAGTARLFSPYDVFTTNLFTEI